MKKYIIILFTILFSILLSIPGVWATPKKIDVIFMAKITATPPTTTFLPHLLINDAWAQDNGTDLDNPKSENGKEGSLPPMDAVNMDIPHCDAKSYHSLFCPPKSLLNKVRKGKMAPPPYSVEMFIDVSSSFELIDPPQKGICARKEFLSAVLNRCARGEVKVQLYNTDIGPMRNLNDSCQTIGLNNKKKLLSWIKASNIDQLIIITDVFEFDAEFYDEITKMGGHFYGDKTNSPISRNNLVDLVSKIELKCSAR